MGHGEEIFWRTAEGNLLALSIILYVHVRAVPVGLCEISREERKRAFLPLVVEAAETRRGKAYIAKSIFLFWCSPHSISVWSCLRCDGRARSGLVMRKSSKLLGPPNRFAFAPFGSKVLVHRPHYPLLQLLWLFMEAFRSISSESKAGGEGERFTD